ncbi:MAG: hypothetical protein ACTHOI_09485 [Sphingomicrobium sp.]
MSTTGAATGPLAGAGAGFGAAPGAAAAGTDARAVRMTVCVVLWRVATATGFAAFREELVVVVLAGAVSGVTTGVSVSTVGAGVALTAGSGEAGSVVAGCGWAGTSWARAWVDESARAAAIAGRALVHA